MLLSGSIHRRIRFAIFTIALPMLSAGTVRAEDLSDRPHPGVTREGDRASTLPFNPQDGETVVFLGDSITHQCLYTQYVEDFFYTRYPDRRIDFYNAGVSGDKASDALVRFDEDVATFDPDYVTILFGMNDGQYEDFDDDTFDQYESSVNALLDRIESIGARAIVLSPTMFDHAQVSRRQNDETWRFRTRSYSPTYNALMAFYGGWSLENAGRRGLPFVNLWGPLNRHTIDGRRAEPDFTLISDAIHPQAAGQMVMAFEVLSQLGVERTSASSIVITKRGDRWTGKGVQDLAFDSATSTLTFSYLAASLPWVVPVQESTQTLKWQLPSDAHIGYRITKAGHKLSADRVKIVGLPAGHYQVSIDDVPIGTWTHVALGTKIEIQENPATPQYQQASRVARLNRDRNDEAIRPLRDKWSTVKGLRRRYADDPDKLDANLAKVRPVIAELNQLAENYQDQIYEANRPKTHRWKIRLVESPIKRKPR